MEPTKQDKMMTQDEICADLAAYLTKKGVTPPNQTAWTHRHEVLYKEFAYFALGVRPPILVPTSAETLPAALLADPDWHEVVGTQPAPVVVAAGETTDATAPTADEGTPEGATADDNEVKVAENGDLSFVMNTGVHQKRPPTEGEVLATQLGDSADQLGAEIAEGDVVTQEAMTEASKQDADEGDAPVTAPATEGETESEDESEDEDESAEDESDDSDDEDFSL